MGHKLLLADDSITIQKVVGIIFFGEAYALTVVGNGSDALLRAREVLPDIMLIDTLMPEKNGYEVCREVRKDPLLSGIPILLLTGVFEPFDEQKARESGADDFISKPFESQVLIDKVKELIAVGAARRAASPPPPLPEITPAAEIPEDEEGILEIEEITSLDDLWGMELAGEELPEEIPFATVVIPPEEGAFAGFEELIPFAGDEQEPARPEPLPDITPMAWGGDEFTFEEVIEPVTETAPADEFTFDEEQSYEPLPFPEPAAETPAELLPEETPLPTDESAEGPEEESLSFGEFTFPEPQQYEPLVFPEPAAETPAVFLPEEPLPLSEEPEEMPLPFGAALQAADEPLVAPLPGEEEFFPMASGIPEEVIVLEGGEPALVTPPVAAETKPLFTEEQLREALATVSREVIQRIVWEVVPDLAEALIKEEIRKIREGV